jgi:phosphate transport system protein
MMIQEKIIELKESIIQQANDVEKMIDHCLSGFVEKNKNTLKKVIDTEEVKINKNEIKIDEQYNGILALYHAEAKELRTILMISKMNIDLERVADQCVNFAESAIFLIEKPMVKPLVDIPRMAELAKRMLNDSINAFTNEDAGLAQNVCRRDEEIDNLNEQVVRELLTYMIEDPQTIERAYHLIRIAHNIEKIADLSTNIAEEVVFIAEGRDIKHHKFNVKRKK